MPISNELVKKFAKIVAPTDDNKKVTMYGTVRTDGTDFYVRLDGSSIDTPIDTTVDLALNDRVMVDIFNHMAVVTGNLTSKSVGSTQFTEFKNELNNTFDVLNTNILNANTIFTDYIQANSAEIESLKAGVIEARKITTDYIQANNAEIENLKSAYGEIGTLKSDSIETRQIVAGYVQATNAEINTIKSSYIETDKLSAAIGSLDAGWIQTGMIGNGVIKTAQIANGAITSAKIGELDANKITAGTLTVDRLLMRDANGNYKFVQVPAEDGTLTSITLYGDQITKRSISADTIVAGSITAAELNVENIFANTAVLEEILSHNITATGTITGLTIEGAKGHIGFLTINQNSLFSNHWDLSDERFNFGINDDTHIYVDIDATVGQRAQFFAKDSVLIKSADVSIGNVLVRGINGYNITLHGNTYIAGSITVSDNANLNASSATRDADGNDIRNKYVNIYNSSDITRSSTVTVNDLAKQGSAVAMIAGETDNPLGKGKWIHVWSQAWEKTVNTNWVSQIALGANDNNGMWYRTSPGSCVGLAWKRVLDSSNYSSYALPLSGGTLTGTLTLKNADGYGYIQVGTPTKNGLQALIYGSPTGGNIGFRYATSDNDTEYAWASIGGIVSSINGKLDKSGGTLTNNLVVGSASVASSTYRSVKAMNAGNNALLLAANGPAGVWHEAGQGSASKWLISINTSGTVTANTSDKRYKVDKGFLDAEETKTILNELDVVNFVYKEDVDRNNLEQSGIYAQDLRDILLRHGYKNKNYLSLMNISNQEDADIYYDITIPEEDVRYEMNYSALIPLLVKGWQIQQKEIIELREEIRRLSA